MTKWTRESLVMDVVNDPSVKLSVRALNCLQQAAMGDPYSARPQETKPTLGELADAGPAWLMRRRNCGRVTAGEIAAMLEENGLSPATQGERVWRAVHAFGEEMHKLGRDDLARVVRDVVALAVRR